MTGQARMGHQAELQRLSARVRELEQEINTPEIVDFGRAVQLEAARAAGWKDSVVMDLDAEVPLLVFETVTGSEIVVVNLAATTVRGQELQPAGRAATLDALLRPRQFYLVRRRP